MQQKYKITEKEKYQANPEKYVLSRARWEAKRHKREFNLTLEDIVIPEYCPILNVKLSPVLSAELDFVPSLDRVDNSKGYVKGNVKVISYKANVQKKDMTIDYITRLYNHITQV